MCAHKHHFFFLYAYIRIRFIKKGEECIKENNKECI